MNKIVFRFYTELNDFLPTNKKSGETIYCLRLGRKP